MNKILKLLKDIFSKKSVKDEQDKGYIYDSKGNVRYRKNPDDSEEWFDENGDLIHQKSGKGITRTEFWYDYDDNHNQIYSKDFMGFETWYDYDENGNQIHSKTWLGYEEWFDYDEEGNMIHYRNSNGDEKWFSPVKGKVINLKEFKGTTNDDKEDNRKD